MEKRSSDAPPLPRRTTQVPQANNIPTATANQRVSLPASISTSPANARGLSNPIMSNPTADGPIRTSSGADIKRTSATMGSTHRKSFSTSAQPGEPNLYSHDSHRGSRRGLMGEGRVSFLETLK